MTDTGYRHIIRVRDPVEAIQMIAAAPPCPTVYRGVTIYSDAALLRHYRLIVIALAFQPESVIRRVGAIGYFQEDDHEVMALHLTADHQSPVDAEIVLEHILAAAEVYGHPLILVANSDGWVDGCLAAPCLGSDGSRFDSSRWSEEAEGAQ